MVRGLLAGGRRCAGGSRRPVHRLTEGLCGFTHGLVLQGASGNADGTVGAPVGRRGTAGPVSGPPGNETVSYTTVRAPSSRFQQLASRALRCASPALTWNIGNTQLNGAGRGVEGFAW
ncbi:hypothetical protein STTU_6005 [Streptomyces sp. Tu6071]|nr:hypothetical protein STTU_6005 [Streptomyces sp. Tu6071]